MRLFVIKCSAYGMEQAKNGWIVQGHGGEIVVTFIANYTLGTIYIGPKIQTKDVILKCFLHIGLTPTMGLRVECLIE